MVRWRSYVVLALLLLLPARISSKLDAEDEDEGQAEDNDEDDSEDDEEETEQIEKVNHIDGRQDSGGPTPKALVATRTTIKGPLECYVCAFKAEIPLRACLDPTKYRVHSMICHNTDDKCFTAITSKGSIYEAVIRGCRSGCVNTANITCCEANRCNNQSMAFPMMPPRVGVVESKSNKPMSPTVLFFVTVLLLLQTVVKVSL